MDKLERGLKEKKLTDTVEITVSRCIELLYAEEELYMLHVSGVDNWTWYDESLRGENAERWYPDCDVCCSTYFACTCKD